MRNNTFLILFSYPTELASEARTISTSAFTVCGDDDGSVIGSVGGGIGGVDVGDRSGEGDGGAGLFKGHNGCSIRLRSTTSGNSSPITHSCRSFCGATMHRPVALSEPFAHFEPGGPGTYSGSRLLGL